MAYTKSQYAWIGLRLSLGWMFLWGFLDKLLGLGFTTCKNAETIAITFMCDKAWINGGSPTMGFLKFGTTGPLKPLYAFLADNLLIVTDILFMAALLVIGITLITGIEMKKGAYIGALLSLMMWSALLLPEHNPLVDEHIIYLFAFLVLAHSNADSFFTLKKKRAAGKKRKR